MLHLGSLISWSVILDEMANLSVPKSAYLYKRDQTDLDTISTNGLPLCLAHMYPINRRYYYMKSGNRRKKMGEQGLCIIFLPSRSQLSYVSLLFLVFSLCIVVAGTELRSQYVCVVLFLLQCKPSIFLYS